MTLSTASIEWAIDFVAKHSDGDLFPKIPEVEAILARKNEFVALTAAKPLTIFSPGPCRRFIVPKDDISYRQATQLDPQDSILLSAIVYEFGGGIESRRAGEDKVFSYRFLPSIADGFYRSGSPWNSFWKRAHHLSQRHSHILYCDISDFYNQIYHHAVENQLIASNFPNQAVKWVIALLESTTAGVSRGIPIGPHAVHLIAEATLIPIDNAMSTAGVKFIRYADDIIVFCGTEKEARSALANIASILDKQQRLTLQRHKTKFYNPNEFQEICAKMIEDRPINSSEADLVALIKKYTGGDPYKTISYDRISAKDWQSISEKTIRGVIEEYVFGGDTDYIRLRWFYRRLSQIGHPGAILVSLDHIEKLGPCIANICSYLTSVQSIEEDAWVEIGDRLLKLLETDEVRQNEYFRLSILSVFGRNAKINHFSVLAQLYQAADLFVRREVILAAKTNGAIDWVREHKESFQTMDSWQKMAYLYCISGWPQDEKKYFINRWDFDRPFDQTLAKWSKSV